MGQGQSAKRHYRQPNEFYDLCHEGNLDRIRELMPAVTYEELNYTDPVSGHTPLHAACSNNHYNIVRLLLEQQACNRIILNRDGTTAYDVASSSDIRSLFARQCNENEDNRFVDTNSERSSFRLVPSDTSSSMCPNNWLKGYFSATEASDSKLMVSLSQSSNPFLKRFVNIRTEKESQERVYLSIHVNIPFTHAARSTALELYHQFIHKKSVEPLLTLYSLETPLYRALQSDADAYTLLLYLHLNQLRKRTFIGDTYRGATMTDVDIDAYRWAHENSAILETRSLQSTSRNIAVANRFAMRIPRNSTRLSVILHFKFGNICPTAIDLKGLSYFPKRGRSSFVTIYSFKVASIEQRNLGTNHQYEIAMENILVPKGAIFTSARRIIENK